MVWGQGIRTVFTVDDDRQLSVLRDIMARTGVTIQHGKWSPEDGRLVGRINVRGFSAAVPVLNAIAEWNSQFDLPHPYESGVRYEVERGEVFADAREVIRKGYDDCDSLSTFLAGWMRRRGAPAKVVVGPTSVGAHAWVRCGGRDYDPSRVLGMRV